MSKEVEDFWATLKTQRDELRVQAHLARAEMREEWEDVEKKWEKAEQKMHRLQDEAIETTSEMKRSSKIIMDEIASAYDRIKSRLKD